MSNLSNVNKLTEFPALEPEERTDGRFSLSKLLWWRKPDTPTKPSNESDDVNDSSLGGLAPSSDFSSLNSELMEDGKDLKKEDVHVTLQRKSPMPSFYRSDSNLSSRSNPSPELVLDGSMSPYVFEARTLPNVLRRISSLIAMGTNNQTDIKKYWMPDSVSKECYDCAEKFTTFRRKHHCRICGQIFCSRCCSQEIPGKIIGYSGDLRVCTYCCRIVLSYLQSADLNADLTDDLRVVQEDLQNRFGSYSSYAAGTASLSYSTSEYPTSYRSLPRRKTSFGYQEERFAATSNQGRSEAPFDFSPSRASEEKSKLGDFINLKSLWDEICHPVNGVDFGTRRHSMVKNIPSCVVGSELVDWLLAQRKITWRGQGIQIGQMFIDANLLECVSQTEQIFLDAYALYRPNQVPLPPVPESSEDGQNSLRSSYDFTHTHQDPLWVKQIANLDGESETSENKNSDESEDSNTRIPSSNSMYSLDLNVNDITVSLSTNKSSKEVDPYDNSSSVNQQFTKPIPKVVKRGHMSVTSEIMTDEFLKNALSNKKQGSNMAQTWANPQQLTSDADVTAFQRLCNAYVRHENHFTNQLLESFNLSPSWADVILPIVHKVTEIVKPDVRHNDDDMDIRAYVQIKKVPGAKREDSRIVNGVVCTKNIAHRGMRAQLKRPKILLIGSSIDYQRFENRFLSLEPLVMQEHDYLKNTVARIASLTPDLVLVQKTVSRLAQDFFLDQGITLVINMKPSVMERVGRFTQGIISSAADTHVSISRPQLGICHNFYLETFPLGGNHSKTLMFFDGCAMHIGCTILIRGGTRGELSRVKKIMSFLIFLSYNWRLERSYHIDACAMPPLPSEKDDLQDEDLLDSPEFAFKPKYPSIPDSEIEKENLNPHYKSLKEEEGRKLAKSEILEDFSDPLHSYLAGCSETENLSGEKLIEYIPEPLKFHLKKILGKVLLSASPFIQTKLPYLETEEGKSCELRKYFPDEIYWSALLSNVYSSTHHFHDSLETYAEAPRIEWKPPHPFTYAKITTPANSDEVESMLADFRRKGARLDFVSHGSTNLALKKSNYSSWNTVENERWRDSKCHGRVDALDPFRHQRLAVLFCSFSPDSNNAPSFCVNPWVVNMDLYGRNDITLGMFLERYCFRKTYLCPARMCDTSMLQHIRRFAHEDGCVQVTLKELDTNIFGKEPGIVMWNSCSECKSFSPIVQLSSDAWSLSFAKYLELRFHGTMYTRRDNDEKCKHSLHHENVQYFGQDLIIASFKYSKVRIWEVSLPKEKINVVNEPKTIPQLIEDIKSVSVIGHNTYNSIYDILTSLKETSAGLRVEEVFTSRQDQVKAEKSNFRSKIEEIQLNLTSNLDQDKVKREAFLWKITDSIGFLKGGISEAINIWNKNLHDIILLRKKEEKQTKASSKVEVEPSDSRGFTSSYTKLDSEAPPSPFTSQSSNSNSTGKDFEDSTGSSKVCGIFSHNICSGSNEDCIKAIGSNDINVSDSDFRSSFPNSDEIPSSSTPIVNTNPAGLPPSPTQSAKFERRVERRYDEKHFKSGDEDSHEVKLEKRMNVTSSGSTVKTIISNLITGTVVPEQFIQSNWPVNEHHFQTHMTIIPITVFESEPSSIVAFTLSSNEYQSKWKEFVKYKSTLSLPSIKSFEDDEIISKKARIDSGSEEYGSRSRDLLEDKPSTETFNEMDEKERSGKDNQHIEIQFGNNGAKFYCRVYFADQFRQIRSIYMPHEEEFYIRSISRCISWAAAGGKSGSTFCKTMDDRFVIKQMSRVEIQSFLEFAPNYFEYIRSAWQEKKPTLLTKIVGVYRLGFKNPNINTASKMDILIMENLFYERNISRKFDLKGSERNRLADTNRKEQELVLLDENLINMACENPIYIRPHTKTTLAMALSNDSRFLASQMIMDYSLLVGLDEKNNELVVGIIDYIRTYTWEKKIESIVKSSGVLGGQGKMPTVVSPEAYQTRFCEAMDRYFLIVPDCWVGLGLGVDS